MKIILYILVFLLGLCGNFVFDSANAHTTPPKYTFDHPLWPSIQSGRFTPISFLTLKKPMFFANIWQDDKSVLRYVWPNEPLSDRNYRPSDLVSLSGANINEAGRVSQIRAIAKPSVLLMAKDFSEHFWEPLVAISAFRSAEYQQRLWDLWRCNDGAFCAKPWHSEHQLGLWVDFFDATSEEQYLSNPRYKAFYEWMKENAHKYGWTQSYKHGPDVDGYEIEPWHWRYIGNEKAIFLQKLDMSYTRFLNISTIISQM